MTRMPESISQQQLSPDVAAQLRVQVILARFGEIRTEIQWRGVQRDAMVIFAFTIVGVTFGSLNAVGVWALFAAVPVSYLASMWLQHDRRMGSLARYLQQELEPAMNKYDGLRGLEDFLDEAEPSRKTGKHFSSVMSRLLFPSLMMAAIGTGVGLFISRGSFGAPINSLFMVVVAIMLVATAVTLAKVKHIRTR